MDYETGVVKLEIYVDGKLYSSVNGSEYSGVIKLAPGTHEIKAVAYDKTGNNKAASVTVTASVKEEEEGAPPKAAAWAILVLIAIGVIIVLMKRK